MGHTHTHTHTHTFLYPTARDTPNMRRLAQQHSRFPFRLLTHSSCQRGPAQSCLKTLPVRMKEHEKNANEVANYLNNHPAIKAVYFPGLSNHPGHEIAKRQQKGFGAMMSFEINGGVEAVKVLFDKLALFTLAQSLGGVESLISHPSTMTHAGMEIEAQILYMKPQRKPFPTCLNKTALLSSLPVIQRAFLLYGLSNKIG